MVETLGRVVIFVLNKTATITETGKPWMRGSAVANKEINLTCLNS